MLFSVWTFADCSIREYLWTISSLKIQPLYGIPEIFCGMYISWLSMEPGFLQLKFRGRRLFKSFRTFHAILHSYVRRIYATNLSEIDKAPYQMIYHSLGNPPRPPCGKSWAGISTVASEPVKVDQWHHHALLKNNMQMHEMTRSI